MRQVLAVNRFDWRRISAPRTDAVVGPPRWGQRAWDVNATPPTSRALYADAVRRNYQRRYEKRRLAGDENNPIIPPPRQAGMNIHLSQGACPHLAIARGVVSSSTPRDERRDYLANQLALSWCHRAHRLR